MREPLAAGVKAAAPFAALAADYDRYRLGYSDELYDVLAEHGIVAGSRVLDVACGTGLVTVELYARGCDVLGIDACEPMLERARAHLAHAPFICTVVEETPFRSGRFDAATCAQAFHWFDQGRSFAELLRIVRPGGTLAIWWKTLMRGDPIRLLRAAAARELGLEPAPEVLAEGFPAFERSALADQRLRVIPWAVSMSREQYLGYERSRARAYEAYGERTDEYLARLERRLATRPRLALSYLQMLYLGRVPESA
ncbi:MAG: class I SAM-dependent methyltransferase [Vulcanimicrobiaceae bacterium]